MVSDMLISLALALSFIAFMYMLFFLATLADLSVRIFSFGKQGLLVELPKKKDY
jgi:hypothetical protein